VSIQSRDEAKSVEERIERRARLATFLVAFAAALIAFAMNRVQVDQANTPRSTPPVTAADQSFVQPESPVEPDPTDAVEFG
jgi:hypothetical protein